MIHLKKAFLKALKKLDMKLFCETLKFIYGADFENIMPHWANDASKEFYSRN